MEVDIILEKNLHNYIIMVVFQNQTMYIVYWCKTCKIGEKGCVFDHVYKYWLEHDGQIQKEHEKQTTKQQPHSLGLFTLLESRA